MREIHSSEIFQRLQYTPFISPLSLSHARFNYSFYLFLSEHKMSLTSVHCAYIVASCNWVIAWMCVFFLIVVMLIPPIASRVEASGARIFSAEISCQNLRWDALTTFGRDAKEMAWHQRDISVYIMCPRLSHLLEAYSRFAHQSRNFLKRIYCVINNNIYTDIRLQN